MVINLRDAKGLNELAVWEETDSGLTLTTDADTDFWRKTHYGFTHDIGHFLGTSVDDGFTAHVRVQGEFRSLYDHAGLMVRIDENRWGKTGVEFTDGERRLACRVADGQ